MTKRGTVENLTWRIIGQPDAKIHLGRWNPGPVLRRAGYRAVDLWAGPGQTLSSADWALRGFTAAPPTNLISQKITCTSKNTPMVLAAANKVARILNIAAHSGHHANTKHRTRLDRTGKAHNQITINTIIDVFLSEKKSVVSPNTYKNYQSSLTIVKKWIGDDVPNIITKELLEDAYHDWAKSRGIHAAHRSISTLSNALCWASGRTQFLGIMPESASFTKLNLMKGPPRLRVALPSECEALLRAFDDPHAIYDTLDTARADRTLPAVPSMGHAFVMMLWTCARVSDALLMRDDNLITDDKNRMLMYRPMKNNHGLRRKVITVPIIGPLAARVPEMIKSRRQLCVISPYLIVSEKTRTEYVKTSSTTGIKSHTHFTALWKSYRKLAGQIKPSLIGQGFNRSGEAWLPFNAQDCRDTGVTRLWNATGDLTAVSTYHGSSPQELIKLAKHYIEIDPFASVSAGRDLLEWANKAGVTV